MYKGGLCARGDSAPLTHAPFTSSPTVSRRGAKLAAAIATLGGFEINSIDVSQSFSQSGNLAEPKRCIILPPAIIPMPWEGVAYSPETDLKSLPPANHGFLIFDHYMVLGALR